jgi:hypothetical protein
MNASAVKTSKPASKNSSQKTTGGRSKPPAKAAAERKTNQPTVDTYIAGCGPEWTDVLQRLRVIIRRAAPQADESLNWGKPWYSQNGMLCYFSVGKSHVTFGFRRATQLRDPDGLFEGSGKDMRHVKICSAADIRPRQFASWVRQSVDLNCQNPLRL